MIFKAIRISAVVSALFLIGCSSVSTLQTAQTTPKGTFRHAIGVGSLKATVSDVSGVKVDSADSSKTEISLPMVEYMARYGFTDRFDVGLRTTGTVYGADAKYKLIDGDMFLMSVGAGGTYLSYSYYSGGTSSEVKVTAFDLVPAVFFDVNFTQTLGLYLVPKYVYRTVSVTGSSNQSVGYLGGSIGLKWGKTAGVFIEYTYLSATYTNKTVTPNVSSDVNLGQLAGGVFF